MYEKNCLTHSYISLVQEAPYTIVVQMHPASTYEVNEFVQKMRVIEPEVKIHHIHAQKAFTQSKTWVHTLLKSVKGPCKVLCIPSFSSFQALLKSLDNPKEHFPCTIVSASYAQEVLTALQIQKVVTTSLQWEDIFTVKQSAFTFLQLCKLTMGTLHTQLLQKANNGN